MGLQCKKCISAYTTVLLLGGVLWLLNNDCTKMIKRKRSMEIMPEYLCKCRVMTDNNLLQDLLRQVRQDTAASIYQQACLGIEFILIEINTSQYSHSLGSQVLCNIAALTKGLSTPPKKCLQVVKTNWKANMRLACKWLILVDKLFTMKEAMLAFVSSETDTLSHQCRQGDSK